MVAGNDGCGHYRMRLPAAALADEVDIEFTEEFEIRVDHGRLVDVAPVEADVLVLQRPLNWWLPDAIPIWQQQGVTVVVEVDDDFRSIDPANGAYLSVHPRWNPEMNWHFLGQCCAVADLVTVTTPALAERYGPHGRVAVLPNYVPERLLDMPHAGNGRTVGWAGLVSTHPNDLQVTRGGVGDAVRDTNARFLNVGNDEVDRNGINLVQKYLALPDKPAVTGWVGVEDYYRQISRMDVGIVPLADTRFNAAKSWLKGLEYAALGVPFVASSAAEYVRLEDLLIGTTVKDRARDWRKAVRVLLEDREQWAWISEAGRERAARLTIEANAWRWAEAWEEALRCAC